MDRNVSPKDIGKGIVLLHDQLLVTVGHVESRIIVRNGLKVEPHKRHFGRPVRTTAQDQTNGGGLTDGDRLKAKVGVVAALPAIHSGGSVPFGRNGHSNGCQAGRGIDGWIGRCLGG